MRNGGYLLRVLLVFIDGIGLGELSPANPFVSTEMPSLQALLQGRPLTREAVGRYAPGVALLGLDACLGVEGLPQSATGQASIFTGENAPRLIGRHLKGFPNRDLRGLLAAKGMFGRLRQSGYSCTFVNAYRPQFFEMLNKGLPGRHYSCSTLITYYAGLSFNGLDELREGKALYMDIDNTLLNRSGYALPEITPEEAGRRLVEISQNFAFTLFEFFLSDLAGHSDSREEARKVLTTLDRFLGAVVQRLDPQNDLLIITSDHGNLEDLSHRDHTMNEVPALLVGPSPLCRAVAPQLKDITGIFPTIRTVLEGQA